MFDTILLPIDLTHPESWEKALPAARKCAGATGTTHILGIVHDLGSAMVASYLPVGFEQKALTDMQAALQEFHQKHLPSAQVHIIPGSGHWPFIDDPPAVIELLTAFLDSVE